MCIMRMEARDSPQKRTKWELYSTRLTQTSATESPDQTLEPLFLKKRLKRPFCRDLPKSFKGGRKDLNMCFWRSVKKRTRCSTAMEGSHCPSSKQLWLITICPSLTRIRSRWKRKAILLRTTPRMSSSSITRFSDKPRKQLNRLFLTTLLQSFWTSRKSGEES